MPTSPYAHIYTFVRYLDLIRPSSLLDIGLGNGRIGFIARDLLDVMLGERYKKSDRQVKIDGIEVFPDYIQKHQKEIYDDIYIGDAYQVIDQLGHYDVIVLGDVLEHFEKKRAYSFLDKCFEHADKYVIIFIPLGEKWVQPEIYGNPHEKHQSFWSQEEFEPMVCAYEYFNYSPGRYGAFLIKKEDYIDYRIGQLKAAGSGFKPHLPVDIRKHHALSKEKVSNIDLSRFFKHVADQEHLKYFSDTDFKEHYRLIAYLSTLFNSSPIFDIGTNRGYSALALSYNQLNLVISYDIADYKDLAYPQELTNIEYRSGDVLQDSRLLTSPLIMLDTNHDGVFENQFYNFIKQNRYKGLLFLDDIHLNPPMKDFWNRIPEAKADITDLGHWSGSGIVDFGCN